MLPVNAGVPQGSILGPLMFIMFVNDITSECPCYLFADDCIIEQSGETPEIAISKTNILLPSIANWYNTNLLRLNDTKTSCMILSNKHVSTDNLTPVELNGHAASFTNSMKYLGLHVDPSLTWNVHVSKVKQKVLPLIWKFAKIRHLINNNTARMYYISLIRPRIEYAAPVLYNMSTKNSNCLEILQNRCLKILTKSNSRTHADPLRKKTGIPSLSNRRKYYYLTETYKFLNNMTPQLSDNNIITRQIQNKYNLRSSSTNLERPRMNKSVGQRAFCYLAPHTYNSLPNSIKESPSLSMF